MSITRFVPYAEPEFPWYSGIEEREDGEYVLYSDYAALEARCAGLEREAEKHKERRKHFEDLLNDSIRKETEWLRKALDAEVERDALQAKLAAAEARADAFHAALVKARPCGVCGGSKQIVSKRSQEIETCPGCNGYGFDIAIIAGHAPATPMLDQLAAPPQPITVQAAPSDREKRLESALREIRDKHAMDNEGAGSFISQVNELEDIARAALAGTTTDEVQP